MQSPLAMGSTPSMYMGALACAALASCALEPLPEQLLFEDTALQTVAERRYLGAGFMQVNATSYPTALSETDLINVYVNEDDAKRFAAIDPAVDGSGVRLDTGATIVREVLDAGGRLRSVTMMIKGPRDFYPDAGDYFFAVVNDEGSDFVDDIHGRDATCASCHVDRANDDYLFGIDRRYVIDDAL